MILPMENDIVSTKRPSGREQLGLHNESAGSQSETRIHWWTGIYTGAFPNVIHFNSNLQTVNSSSKIETWRTWSSTSRIRRPNDDLRSDCCGHELPQNDDLRIALVGEASYQALLQHQLRTTTRPPTPPTPLTTDYVLPIQYDRRRVHCLAPLRANRLSGFVLPIDTWRTSSKCYNNQRRIVFAGNDVISSQDRGTPAKTINVPADG